MLALTVPLVVTDSGPTLLYPMIPPDWPVIEEALVSVKPPGPFRLMALPPVMLVSRPKPAVVEPIPLIVWVVSVIGEAGPEQT